jgi:hypothetical protein
MHKLAIASILAKPSSKVKAWLVPASHGGLFGPETGITSRIAPSVKMGVAIVERMSPVWNPMTQFESGINEILRPGRGGGLI